MKKILFLLLAFQFIWARGDFYELYQKNRVLNRASLITADFIASAYAIYKLNREKSIERKILYPRLVNFSNYLYKASLKANLKAKEQLVAYSAILSLFANNGKIVLPTRYEHLEKAVIQEAISIVKADKVGISPITHIKIDYREFAVPKSYNDLANFYRILKYTQTIPLNSRLKKHFNYLFKNSKRVFTLKRYILNHLQEFVGVKSKRETLFPSYQTLDYDIFKKSNRNISIDTIQRAIMHNPTIKKHIFNLYSSYDYDFKIMQTLIKNGHINAFKGYYTQSHYRNLLYIKKFESKSFSKTKESRNSANIEAKLEETLSVMIEGALMFSNTIRANQTDKAMIETLKELRRIAQTKSMGHKLSKADIAFLNNLDQIFLEIIGKRDRPISVKVTKHLTEKLLAPKPVGFSDGSWGARFVHREM